MKKKNIIPVVIAVVLVLVLMLSMVGCNASSDDKEKEAYCYVVHVESNGFVADIIDVGVAYIEYSNANQEIELFDTVIIEYDEADLIEENGTYTGITGESASFSYKITNLNSVRVADPSKGEEVFD